MVAAPFARRSCLGYQRDNQMTAKTLSTLIGTAVIDMRFRQTLLSDPWSALTDFDLSLEEKEAIAGIEANTIEQFAQQLAGWIAEVGDPLYG